MQTDTTGCAQLYLLIQRLLDQELLRDTDAAELLADADAARKYLLAGDQNAALHQVGKVGELIRALVRTDVLSLAEARAVIQLADEILSKDPKGMKA